MRGRVYFVTQYIPFKNNLFRVETRDTSARIEIHINRRRIANTKKVFSVRYPASCTPGAPEYFRIARSCEINERPLFRSRVHEYIDDFNFRAVQYRRSGKTGLAGRFPLPTGKYIKTFPPLPSPLPPPPCCDERRRPTKMGRGREQGIPSGVEKSRG